MEQRRQVTFSIYSNPVEISSQFFAHIRLSACGKSHHHHNAWCNDDVGKVRTQVYIKHHVTVTTNSQSATCFLTHNNHSTLSLYFLEIDFVRVSG